MKRLAIALGLLGLAGCQSTLLSEDRIVSNTAASLGVEPSEVTITNRRTSGPNTYYRAKVGRRDYTCMLNGGTALSFGMINGVRCEPAAQR